MTDQPTRRDRLRAETSAEIKATALKLMAAGGPGAIALRAIAREMGMTAGAIYSYFPTRDDLVTALIDDVYTALVDEAEAARDAVKADDPGGRVVAWAQAVRRWALANPEGFRLIYGDPVPGYQPPEDSPAKEAEVRACIGLTGLIAGAWPRAEGAQQDGRDYDWTEFGPELAEKVQAAYPGLPPAAVALSLRVWGRMHGLIALEVYGHLRKLTNDVDSIYRDELADLVGSLGLDS